MCATCVTQGVAYAGGAAVVLRGLQFRARRRTGARRGSGQGGGDPGRVGADHPGVGVPSRAGLPQ